MQKSLPWLVVCLVLYIAALSLPVFIFEKEAPVRGVLVLQVGWFGALMFNFAWFANPMLALTWYFHLSKQARLARVFAIATLALAAFAFLSHQWWFTEANGTPIQAYGPGFWAWLASVAVCVVAVFWNAPGHTQNTP